MYSFFICIVFLTTQLNRLAGRYDNPIPESNISHYPFGQRLRICPTFHPNFKGTGMGWGRSLLLIGHICICLLIYMTYFYSMSKGKGRVRRRGEGMGGN
jgi:hypothetical protein